jgi:isopropylmalate/homocitrate/citramalate synthase
MMYFMRTYRSRLSAPTPITMHTHDDFGMATASTIAAVLAGASPDVALNGVSYRSGFAALEEVVLALDVLYGVDTGINLSRLQWAADRLAEIMDFPIPPLKPVVGSHQNMREAPYQIARMLAGDSDGDFGTMGSSVAPSVTGSKYRWVWATQHSDEIVRMVAAKLGVALSPAEVAETSRRLETRVAAQKTYPKWATEEDVTGAIRAVARTG